MAAAISGMKACCRDGAAEPRPLGAGHGGTRHLGHAARIHDGVVDPGYALHGALKATFGALAPHPFLVRERGRTNELLGYVAAETSAVTEAASVAAALGSVPGPVLNLAQIEARRMPADWTEGRQWSFETRVRPIVRSRSKGRDTASAEIDVAHWLASRSTDGETPSREEAYCRWLGERLATSGAARLVRAHVVAMRSCVVLRRPLIAGKRRMQRVPGPDVTMRGELQIDDPAKFAALLSSGIGRHRAFGFGCLLLAPPGVW